MGQFCRMDCIERKDSLLNVALKRVRARGDSARLRASGISYFTMTGPTTVGVPAPALFTAETLKV